MNDEQLIMRTLFGSHLYGLHTTDSDYDYKGIFMPTKEDLLLQRVPRTEKWSTGNDNQRNVAGDIDYEMFSLHEFVRLALNGETVAIDMLHSWVLDENGGCRDQGATSGEELTFVPSRYSDVWLDLVRNRRSFYTSSMKAYLGYVRRQAAKYGVKGSRLQAAQEVFNTLTNLIYFDTTPYHRLYDVVDALPINQFCYQQDHNDRWFYTVCGRKMQLTIAPEEAREVVGKIIDSYGDRARKAQNNEGIDWKAVSHALRAGYQIVSILKTGDFEYPLQETSYLLDVKQGQRDFTTDVQPELEALVERVESLTEQSSLPTKPDIDGWNKWLVRVLEEHVL